MLDFYCPQRRIVVEVDGSHHWSAKGLAQDATRTDFLAGAGIRVLRFFRFTDTEVSQETEAVAMTIWRAVARVEPSP